MPSPGSGFSRRHVFLASAHSRTLAAIVATFALVSLQGQTAAQSTTWEAGFVDPPASARPRTWWHWTKSNVTLDGITKDLEWMKRVGIAGFQLADVNYGQGQSVEPKTPFWTPQWFEAVRHAAAEADRLGLEMAIFSSPGWSETGGPWVKPGQAMKKLVWSETLIEGPQTFSGKLAKPPSTNGQIRNAAIPATNGVPDPTHYGDSAVVAYRVRSDETRGSQPRVTTPAGEIDGTALLDDDLNTLLSVSVPAGAEATWVQFEYVEPLTAQAITLAGKGTSGQGIPVGRVLASDDGRNFRTLVTLPGAQLYRQGRVRTYSFPVTSARIFRVEMTGAPLGPAATMSQAPATRAPSYTLAEAIVHTEPRVHRWEEKAGFSFLFEYESVSQSTEGSSPAIGEADVVDLTKKMAGDGALAWDVPQGSWRVLRLGYSLTGAKTRPATPAGSGFEADKLSRRHMEAYIRDYFDPLQKALGPLFGKSLRYVMMDSWEAGTNNWTEDLLAEFEKRRGYDPMRYLPALTGRIVESPEISNRFLWDFRRTLADLWADYHYGTMSERLRERGLGIYAEAAGVSLEMAEDTLLNKSKVEIPMGEFWVRDLHPRLMYFQDVRGAASAAHAYGKKIVAAESFTGGGFESPYTLKKVADYWLAQGINRLVFHTSAHQPLDTAPGNAMVGTHLHRNITWAEAAAPFVTYLARSSYMLQQGKFVADIVYLLDEGAPSTPPIWGAGTQPRPPEGYDYDFINADVLLNRMSVADDGRLMLPDGMSYRVLVLPQSTRMRPELARKIRALVLGGATIVGAKPSSSPSLARYPEADRELNALTSEIWGDLDGASRTVRRVGKGRVVWGLPLHDALAAAGVDRDFEWAGPLDAEVAWLHRQRDDADIYYVANTTDRAVKLDVRVRVAGKNVERWQPDSGAQTSIPFEEKNGRTTIPLQLAEREAVFLVLRTHAAMGKAPLAPLHLKKRLGIIDGKWSVSFPPDRGAPLHLQFPALTSWTQHAEPGVKYFSGTAVYSKTFSVPADWMRAGRALSLDLGGVRDLAEVYLNGRRLALLWKPPYVVAVTDALVVGENRLEVKVTNQWTNRLLGDARLPAEQKVLHGTPVTPGTPPNAEPPESGLLGPVSIIAETDAESTD